MKSASNDRSRAGRSRQRSLAWALGLLASLASGCDRGAARAAAPTTTDRPADRASEVARLVGQAIPPTTAGSIAVGNLESQLRSVERRLSQHPRDTHTRAELTELLLGRAQYLGRPGDYDRALALSAELVSDAPAEARSWLLRSSARAALHDFAGASADLDRAAALGASPSAVAAARADLLDATGGTEAALVLREEAAARRPTITSLAAAATSHALAGDEERAKALFSRALHDHRDVSPFPVAWLLAQRALAWERAGDVDAARAAFAVAHERLPAYAAAASGLARLTAASGDHLAAAAILRALVVTSDDPEYVGQLAGELRALGEAAEADRLREEAARRIDDLVARHPDAFIAKQVRFWLGPGGDPERGFAIARRNLATSGSSPPALALAAEAALAAQKAATARPGS